MAEVLLFLLLLIAAHCAGRLVRLAWQSRRPWKAKATRCGNTPPWRNPSEPPHG